MTLPEMCTYHMHYGADPHRVHMLLTLVQRDRQEMSTLTDTEVQALEEAWPGFATHRRHTLTTYAASATWTTQPYKDAHPYDHARTEHSGHADCQACAWERNDPGADEADAYEAARQTLLREEAP